jgi:hypothetical protein
MFSFYWYKNMNLNIYFLKKASFDYIFAKVQKRLCIVSKNYT